MSDTPSQLAKPITLPAIPVRDMVLFPDARVPFVVGRKGSAKTLERRVKAGDHMVLFTQKDPKEESPEADGLYEIGTLALVESLIALPRDYFKVGVKGISRVRLERYFSVDESILAEVTLLEESPSSPGLEALRPQFFAAVQAFLDHNPDAARLLRMESIQNLSLDRAIDTVASQALLEVRDKQKVLETLDVEQRLNIFLELLEMDATRQSVDQELEEKTRARLDEDHKHYVLSEKMRVIQKELGRKNEQDEFQRLKDRILEAKMSEEAEKKALEELERLESMPPQSAESTVSRTYIDWLLALPWQSEAEEHLELDAAEAILEEDHAGLEQVKARILEYLAVMKRLRDHTENGQLRGPILCLVGPPGVGKTSLARSIARSLNRPFVRFSLGGVRDEAEIRGHRRTYIGSMPGRIISLMKKCAVRNPLMLLDEIDKMASDWRGDPASALLEVLDPEQNASFQDHYLDLGFDLSKVLFLCTANVRHNIPHALEDRLEVIELSGYTQKEKVDIATRHLLPKAIDHHGMKDLGVEFSTDALQQIIHAYTKEAGVRQLERELSAVLRKLARHQLQPQRGDLAGEAFNPKIDASRLKRLLGPEKFLDHPLEEKNLPGVVNGLAWTSTGGDLLTIEAATLPGKGNLKLTGKLGEVMQESAQIALSYVRTQAEHLGLQNDFLEKLDVHVHVPEGAIPKDGPSAGITIATALVSALTKRSARADVAMTGELTLLGRVLPIGGLKEKLLAAHRMGCKTVIIPKENERHLEEIPQEVRDELKIHSVVHMDEVLALAILKD